MQEHGYFHDERGYWQTLTAVSPEILATYPDGTIEISLKPNANCEWDGSKWAFRLLSFPTVEEQQAARQAAFQREADPLFFKWQAGEGTEEAWQAKRAEIRERYPYPE